MSGSFCSDKDRQKVDLYTLSSGLTFSGSFSPADRPVSSLFVQLPTDALAITTWQHGESLPKDDVSILVRTVSNGKRPHIGT